MHDVLRTAIGGDIFVRDGERIGQIPVQKIIPVVSALCDAYDLRFDSLLDVGCWIRPQADWFMKFRRADEPKRYIGMDVDTEAQAALEARGLLYVSSFSAPFDVSSDLVMALEVIEHLTPTASVPFLRSCAKVTNQMFALTTPNFVYWKNFRAKKEYSALRWIPDHATDFNPRSTNPHAHKQEMSAGLLIQYMREAFPSPEWQTAVFEAWPWKLQDLSKDEVEYTLYFKVFAIALRSKLVTERP